MDKVLLDTTLEAMSGYLFERKWRHGVNEIFYLTDPLTGAEHRTDFAFIIESERHTMEILNKSKLGSGICPISTSLG